MNVNETTPTIIRQQVNSLSIVELALISPYPIVVVVVITKYKPTT